MLRLFRAIATLCVVILCCTLQASCFKSKDDAVNVRIKFLVTVNVTWEQGGCLATVLTKPLESWRSYNETTPITVGHCDHGPLTFSIEQGSQDGVSKLQVDLQFFSSVLDYGADIPVCRIPWNATYINPTMDNPHLSPLPSCWTNGTYHDGSHVTYYWFRLVEWEFYG